MPEGIIRPLSKEIISRIAAGEVVERPSAAVKELVENSIDAGDTAVTVDIRDGGVTAIRVTDNGCGIYPEDILMAFKSHATSKISTAEDLYGVASLGFRGEALSSIAAASKVTLKTRRKGAETGVEAVNEGGQMLSVRECACPEGTVIQVRELFFNAPVRRNFLKKPAMEGAFVAEIMQRFILSRPDISFRFVSDGRNVYFSPGSGSLRDAALAVFPLAVVRQMTPVEGVEAGVRLSGLVGTGDASRGNRGQEFFFLNGRTLRSGVLSSAVEEACRQLVTIGRFPLCALHLEIPFDRVDVNVHPNKWEVRFADEAAVRQAVRDIVSDALTADRKAEDKIPPVFLEDESVPAKPAGIITRTSALPKAEEAPSRQEPSRPLSPVFGAPVVMKEAEDHPYHAAPNEKALPDEKIPGPDGDSTLRRDSAAAPAFTLFPGRVEEATPVKEEPREAPAEQASMFSEKPEEAAAEAVILGTAFSTYIIVEAGDRLLMCDQHAIHERLLYEELMRQAGDEPPIQTLLMPRAIPLRDKEYTVCADNLEALYRAGFDVEPLSDRTVMLRGLPLILGEPQAEMCFHAALDELISHGGISQTEKVQRLTQMACKHAVKGGEKLDAASVKELVERMLREDIRLTCPHGRPLMIQLTKADIEKRFKRIQESHD